jgi:signal peptide peptidase SppA
MLRRLLPNRFGGSPLVPVLRLNGAIGMAMPMGGSITFASTVSAIERAFSLKGTVAVALVVNSPGGSPVQSRLIFQRIRVLAEEKSIPVFAFAEDVAASGGYLLACAADEIYADPSSILGSIGVVSSGFGFAEAIGKLGIERRVHTAGKNKARLDPFLPEREDDVAHLKAIQLEIHDVFKDLVRTRRGARLKGDEDELFSGEFWAGGRALELGLIDGIGDMRAVLRGKFGDKVKFKVVTQPRSWLRRRLGMGGRHIDVPDGASFAQGVLNAMEIRALWSRFGL